MVRDNRKSKIINIIVFVSLSLFILFVGHLIYTTYKKYNIEVNVNSSLNQELAQVTEMYNQKNDTNIKLKQEIDDLNNIDNNIINSKNEVFKLAKELEQKIIKNESDKKIAYLTFDDGPYYATNDFLKVLKKHKVKATFFTIGLDKENCFDNRSKKCNELYKKVVDQGHTIANHTYSHLIFNGLYSNASNLIKQVKKQEKLIKDKTGVTTNIFRFPGGSGTAKYYGAFNSAVKELRKNNYGWVDWSAANGDGGDPGTKSQALARFKDEINEDIEVVLFHDYSRVTLSMLPDAIEYLQKKGYVLLPLFYDSVKINK